jgi:hypothetical protein
MSYSSSSPLDSEAYREMIVDEQDPDELSIQICGVEVDRDAPRL